VGGIAGALAFSMILIPSIGTQAAERWLVALPAIAAVIALGRRVKTGMLAAGVVAAALLALSVHPVPWLAIAYGRRMNQYVETAGRPLYIGEGMNASIVVSELTTGARYFHVSGKVEATTETFDMRLQRMLGHISALFARQPESVLVVGFGAGVTAGTFTLHPETKSIVICELERMIPPATTQYFNRENYDVLHDPRTRVYYDDARHFVLTSKDKFDVITSDPIHPWVKGTATLYSKEYFEMCKRHLKPGGVVTQWVPLYESDPETIKSELATFFEVFPHATIWNSDASNQGYDVVVLGQAEPGPIDIDALDLKLRRPEYARVAGSLNEVGLGSALDLLTTYAGRQDELRPWLSGAQINRDLNMRLQYLAGWGLNYNYPAIIYRNLLMYRGFPQDLFTGSAESVQVLRALLDDQVR
jgi:spermidine synthase